MSAHESRNAAAMNAGQMARESVPDEWDDDVLTEEQALDLARDESLSCGAGVADALAVICDPIQALTKQTPVGWPGRECIDVPSLCKPEYDNYKRPAYELLAVVMLGDDKSALRALRSLREQVAGAMADQIKQRSAELLRADAQSREQEPA